MMKNNLMSKAELIEKIKTDKVVKTEHYIYKAERVEQVENWRDNASYTMDYIIYRKSIEEDDEIGFKMIYRERIEDNFIMSDII